MIIAALILGLCIVAAAWISSLKHVKPRMAFAQVTLLGQTEQSETMQLSATLFADEPEGVWQEKIAKVCELRESRLKFQNERILAATKAFKEEQETGAKAKELAKAGLSLVKETPTK